MAATSKLAATSNHSRRGKLDEEAILLPQDLILKILVRLPIKSIVRFKSTCKTWYALIRSRYFIKLHREFHPRVDYGNHLFFYDQGGHSSHVYSTNPSSFQSTTIFDVGKFLKVVKSATPSEIRVTLNKFGIDLHDQEILVHEPNIILLGPLSNGIYCLVTQVYVRTSNYLTYGYSNATVCNFTTGDFKLISPPHVFKLVSPWPVCRRTYAKHVLEVKQHYGFSSIVQKGSDEDIVIDYKMVMIIQDSVCFKVFVYSQRTGVWKLICDSDCLGPFCKAFGMSMFNKEGDKLRFPRITQDLEFLPQAAMNGYCHWMTGEHSILQFDMANEVFELIPGPPNDYPDHPRNWLMRLGVFVLDDHLAAIIIQHGFPYQEEPDDPDVDIWIMNEYGVGKSWTKIQSGKCQFDGVLQKFLGMSFSRDCHGRMTIESMFFQVKLGMLLEYDCSGHIVTTHSISERVLSQHSAFYGFWGGWSTFHDFMGADYNSTWDCLKSIVVGYDRSLVCWKTIGLTDYAETLELVTVD